MLNASNGKSGLFGQANLGLESQCLRGDLVIIVINVANCIKIKRNYVINLEMLLGKIAFY